MVSLSDVQIGSVILNMIENVPTYISGTIVNMVDNEVYFISTVTGDTINTSSIDEKYQPALISLTSSSVLRMMEMQGVDVSSISMGDFSISKGGNSSSLSTSQKLRDDGIMKLEALGTKFSYYKALG